MNITIDKDGWNAGFRAGYYGEKPGFHHGFDGYSFSAGYVEGKAKKDGFDVPYFIDQSGQVIEITSRR